MQDLEFTVEKGRLYMLQTRSAKRTAQAAVKVAVDMVAEGLIGEQEAIKRVDPLQVYQLLLPRFDEAEKQQAAKEGRLLTKGLNASPGAATGIAIFDADRADYEKEPDLKQLLEWADSFRRLGVWANADYPRDARRAVVFGAEGIGLCRTEHMFMEQERLPIVQKMILAESKQERQAALDQLLPFQRHDL